MPAYKKKYITLRDAAIISGYTREELKNFAAIGLIPCRKVKSRLYIRFDAFEKIEAHKTEKAKAQEAKPMKTNEMIKSLVPFTAPSQALVKVLEPVAFTAAMFMVLHLTMVPGAAEKILTAAALPGQTLAYMGAQSEELIASSVAIPVTFASAVSDLAPMPVQYASTGRGIGLVAGTSTIREALPPTVTSSDPPMVNFFNGIADASDNYQRAINSLDMKAQEALFTSLTFDKVDPFIQAAFRW